MNVLPFDPHRPRRLKPKADEVREVLADLYNLYYADDLTCDNRSEKHHAVVLRAKAILTVEEISASDERIFGSEAS